MRRRPILLLIAFVLLSLFVGACTEETPVSVAPIATAVPTVAATSTPEVLDEGCFGWLVGPEGRKPLCGEDKPIEVVYASEYGLRLETDYPKLMIYTRWEKEPVSTFQLVLGDGGEVPVYLAFDRPVRYMWAAPYDPPTEGCIPFQEEPWSANSNPPTTHPTDVCLEPQGFQLRSDMKYSLANEEPVFLTISVQRITDPAPREYTVFLMPGSILPPLDGWYHLSVEPVRVAEPKLPPGCLGWLETERGVSIPLCGEDLAAKLPNELPFHGKVITEHQNLRVHIDWEGGSRDFEFAYPGKVISVDGTERMDPSFRIWAEAFDPEVEGCLTIHRVTGWMNNPRDNTWICKEPMVFTIDTLNLYVLVGGDFEEAIISYRKGDNQYSSRLRNGGVLPPVGRVSLSLESVTK